MLYSKKFSLLFLSLLLVFESYGNRGDALKFGKIPDEIVRMTTYDEDPEAEAVVLSHKGDARFEYRDNTGFQIVYKIHKVIKVINKSGLQYADITIPYYNISGRIDNVSNIKGFIYNDEDGKIVKEKLTKDHVFEENVSSTFLLKKISMPNVKEGSVIEVSYDITSNLFSYFREWEFQTSIPTLWSEYTVEFPEYFSYSQVNQGAETYVINEQKAGNGNLLLSSKERVETNGRGLTSSTQLNNQTVNFQTVIYHWALEKAPALRPEPYIDNPMSYATKVEFQLQWVQFPMSQRQNVAASWENLSEELLKDESFGKMLERTKFARDDAQFAVKDAETDLEKIALIMDRVGSKVKWNGKKGLYATKSLEKIYQEGSGSMTDINLILVALLREVGFDANPLVSASRDRGFLNPANPVKYNLNTVTAHVKVDGKDLVLDASDNSLPIGFIPLNNINMRGWLIAPSGQARWVNTQNASLNNETSLINMKIEGETLKAEVSNMTFGYTSARGKRSLKEHGKEKHLEMLEERLADWEVENASWENQDSRHQNLIEKYTISSRDDIDRQGNMIYLQPFEKNTLAQNPFKLDTRKFPIDFIYPQKRQIIWNLEIPEGYKVEEMPESLVTQMPNRGIAFTYRVGVQGNTIQIIYNYQVNQTLYSPEDYASIREFFGIVADKQNESIVLKKI